MRPEFSQFDGADLVLRIHGTGPRRATYPETMQEVVTKELPAFGGLTRQTNPLEVPTTILLRQTTGIRGYSLFVTPGKPPAFAICLAWLDLIGAEQIEMSAEFEAANRAIGAAVR